VIRTLNELHHIGLLVKKKRYSDNGDRATNEYQMADLQDTSVVQGILVFLKHPQFKLVMNVLYAGGKADGIDPHVLEKFKTGKVVSDKEHDGGVRWDAPGVVSDRVHRKNTSIKKEYKEHAAIGFSFNASCPPESSINQSLPVSTSGDYTLETAAPSNVASVIHPQLLNKVSALANHTTEYHIDPEDGARFQSISSLHQVEIPPAPDSPRGREQQSLQQRAAVCKYNTHLRSTHPSFHQYETILTDEAGMHGENLLLATNIACDIGYSSGELYELIRDTKAKSKKCPQGLLLKRLEDGDRIHYVEGYDESNPLHKDTRDRAVYWLEDHGIVCGGQRMILKDHLITLIKLQSYANQADACLEDFCRDYEVKQDAPPGVIVAQMKQHLREHLQVLLASSEYIAASKDLAGATAVRNPG
jgi:hypothetical protein